jgi:hypothetical protein
MSDAYVIEIHGKTVGLIVRYPGGEEGYYIADHNRSAKSFAWTTTTDEILEKLSRIL